MDGLVGGRSVGCTLPYALQVKLDALTKTLDGEIERICNKHYQGR